MENQSKKQPEELLLMTSTPPILGLLGLNDIEELPVKLASFREKGVVKYERTLAIPMERRIPELTKTPEDRLKVSIAIASSMLSAFQHIEKAKMSAATIKEIAEAIIDSSHEDQLSIEDVLLFLKDMLMGKYGKIIGALDMPAFFDIFEKYRDERYKTVRKLRWEEHLSFKSLGDSNRSFDELPLKRNDDPSTMMSMMQTYYDTKGDD
jgi:hypothetical protein